MVQRPRGTRDFAPDETAQRRVTAGKMRTVFERFGFREVQTPTFEELALFTAKSGEAIRKELYDFTDKGDRELTLRPELTAPVMRMYFQDHAFDPKPVKWYYFGNCFRYDRPQTGRYREFWQFGCEQIGAGSPLAYAELIALADGLLESVGLQGRDLRIGHVGILRSLVADLGLPDAAVGDAMRAIDKEDLDGLKALAAQHGAPGAALDALMAALSADTLEGIDAEGTGELAQVFEHLADLRVKGRLHLGVARGLDYYNGVVFEIHCPALEAQSQLVGGGGYDLSAVFDAAETPTMGFGLGFDRTLVALDAEGRDPVDGRGVDVYLGALGDAQSVVTRGARRMRELGLSVDMDLLARKPKQIAKAADAAGARYLVIVGDRDVESGQVQVKELATGGSQEIPIDRFVDWLLEQSGGLDLRDYD